MAEEQEQIGTECCRGIPGAGVAAGLAAGASSVLAAGTSLAQECLDDSRLGVLLPYSDRHLQC